MLDGTRVWSCSSAPHALIACSDLDGTLQQRTALGARDLIPCAAAELVYGPLSKALRQRPLLADPPAAT